MNSRSSVTNLLFVFVVLFTSAAFAQGTGSLRGVVSDPSGAVVPETTVILTSSTGQTSTAVTTRQGVYEIKNLAPGHYTMDASSAGFQLNQTPEVDVVAGQVVTKDIKFDIAVQQQKVTVEDSGTNVEVSPTSTVGAIVLKGKDLDALSDDPDELQSDLMALAGPAAGPNGGQIYIDGFSGGQLPPKSAIREIRVNTNPFSAQFDRIGFGRVEVFTKPGSDKFHGQLQFMDNHNFFNSQNPFAKTVPDYHTENYSGNLSGPISKKASFFLNAEQRDIQEAAVVNAVILDSAFNPFSFTDAVVQPRTRTSITPRVDVQLSQNNTLSMRYQFNRNVQSNNGIGTFSLASLATNSSNIENQVQLAETFVINPTTINETRFQLEKSHDLSNPATIAPTVNVVGAFVNGGSSSGISDVDSNRYEFQNYTSMNRGKHFVKFGARVRVTDLSNTSTGGFNGTYTFASLTSYQITQMGIATGLTPAQIRLSGLVGGVVTPLAICATSAGQAQGVCGGASQYSVTQGQSFAGNTYADAGLYIEDDFRIRPNFTASYGLRYETQNGIGDHKDFAPRVGFAWGLGSAKSTPKTVLRAGYGIFFDRFGQSQILQAQRLNGTTQQQFVVNQPDFFPTTTPTAAQLAGAATSPTIYTISPNIRAPYNSQIAVTVERQVTKSATASVTYLNTRGVHTFDSRNINAPLPGTYNPLIPGSGTRPLGTPNNVYMYESEGVFKQNQMIANGTVRIGQKLSLSGNYALSFAHSDTNGAGSFPTNQYNLTADYGRAAFDIRHRGFIGGSLSAPFNIRLAPFVVLSSGAPFNITSGQDLNGDSIFNDRPFFATGVGSGIVVSRLGTFSNTQQAGQTIVPINYGNGPAQVNVNLRISKTFGLGPKIETENSRQRGNGGGQGGGDRGGAPRVNGGGGGGERGGGGPMGGMGAIFGNASTPHRYNLTLSANARNLLNYVNAAPPVGNISSPLFGTSNSLAGGFGGGNSGFNRRIDLQVQFSF